MILKHQHCQSGTFTQLTAPSCGPLICRAHQPERQSGVRNGGSIRRSQLLKLSIAGGLSAGLQQDLERGALAQGNVPAVQVPQGGVEKVQLKVWEDCELAVAVYPHFTYNAQGAGGVGVAEDLGQGISKVSFDPKQFNIPALDYRSTKILGLPIPPPLRISIGMQKLEGQVNMVTGEATIDFLSKFYFTVGNLYAAAPLVVKANLSTGQENGEIFTARGEKLSNGRGRLVGIAQVPQTGDAFLDSFLMLPSECLAVLSAELLFS